MSLISQLHRVTFRHWTAFALDITAPSAEDAIRLAKSVYGEHGTELMQELDYGDDHWEAERLPAGGDILPPLRRALSALNAAPRFKVDGEDSYAVAADLARLIRNLEGGMS
jgi:hypothetical protein